MKGKVTAHNLALLDQVHSLRRERHLRRLARDRAQAQVASQACADAAMRLQQSADRMENGIDDVFGAVVGQSTHRADIDQAVHCAEQIRSEHQFLLNEHTQAKAEDHAAQQTFSASRNAFLALLRRQEGLAVLKRRLSPARPHSDEAFEEVQ